MATNASGKAERSEQMRNQSEELLGRIKKLLDETIDQQVKLNGWSLQCSNYTALTFLF